MLDEQHTQYLLEDLRREGGESFKILYNTFYKKLTVYSFNLVQDEMDAEDIAAETFMKLYQIRSNFYAYGAIISFLFITARNASINLIKKKNNQTIEKKLAYLQSEEETELSIEPKYPPELVALIKKEIENLPYTQRAVLQLYYYRELKLSVIASIMHYKRDSTARSAKLRALKTLRQKFLPNAS